MIILIAILLTWVTLVVLLHLALFAACLIWRGDAESLKASGFYQALVFAGTIIMAPVFLPLALYRGYRRMRRTYRIGKMVLSRMKHAKEIDLSALPLDEQRMFVQRLRNTEDGGQVLIEALARIKEKQEATK